MSLFEKGSGILDTHLSWNEVESKLQKSLSTSARFGPNRKATNIGEMKGFLSRIALIEPDWIGSDEVKNLPSKLVVKIITQLALIEAGAAFQIANDDSKEGLNKMKKSEEQLKIHHNREVDMYDILESEKNPLIPTIKIICKQKFDENNAQIGFIASEYIPDLTHVGLHESIPHKDLEEMVKAGAAFSAIGEKLGEEKLNFVGRTDFMNDLMGDFFSKEVVQKTYPAFGMIFGEQHKQNIEKLIILYEKYYTNKEFMQNLSKISTILNHQPVLVHADFHNGNMLCFKNEQNQYQLKAVIDYQTVSYLSPGHDMAKLLVSCLSTIDRRENTERLLKLYYETFLNEVGERKAPYTFEQLEQSYKLHFPAIALLVLSGMIPFLMFAPIPEDVKPMVMEMAIGKATGLLEDGIKVHEENEKKYPDLYKF